MIGGRGTKKKEKGVQLNTAADDKNVGGREKRLPTKTKMQTPFSTDFYRLKFMPNATKAVRSLMVIAVRFEPPPDLVILEFFQQAKSFLEGNCDFN
ncbi:hypothetical protein CDAR_595791 [Caerostris darwini]|uniref:Uncharacterized protein n=1 Tax=Caerostris darwini TaxID=1538125 RepID=A0AAV4QB54_9ARAC|nr:hypothetical protein CDAR_595791 [Caerostris darwini]